MRAILQRLIEQSAERGEGWRPSASVLASAWPGLVGDRLAELTRPAEVDWETGRVTVETASEAWSRELARREHALLDRIGQVLPWQIDHLEFRVGALEMPDESRPAATSEESVEPRDRARDSEPVEADDAVEESLDSLPEETAASARRILENIREDQE